MTVTLHSPQVHGFFSVPTDPLTARGLFTNYLIEQKHKGALKLDPAETVVVAPDYGRAGSAARLAEQLGLPAISAEKTRLSDTEVEISNLIVQQVKAFRKVIVYDDEIATGGSVLHLSRLLVHSGIEEIILICTHGLFLNNALERIQAIPQITEIVTTDTVPVAPEKRFPNLTVLPIAPTIGEAIRRNYCRQSIGDLFDFGEYTAG
jgi:ribose-phosphate pyrophosphokinase